MAKRFDLEITQLGGKTTAVVSGVIDERSDLSGLDELGGDVEVDLGAVRRINSFGVRVWIDAMRNLSARSRLAIVNSPPPMVEQMNMIKGFFGGGRLVSFQAPLICPDCDAEHLETFEVDTCRAAGGKLPLDPCGECGGTVEIDDIEEQYLSFLHVDPSEH